MPKLCVDLVNCPVGGELISRFPNGSWRRDRIELMLGGCTVTLRQTQADSIRHLRNLQGQTVHTTMLDFGTVSHGRVRRAERTAEDLAWLLSAATMSPVRPFRYRVGKSIRTLAITNKTSVYRPTIDIVSGEAVRVFIERTWPAFRRFKRARRLPAVIDYLVMAQHPDQPLEVSTLLAFTALESLKATHSPGERNRFKQRVDRMLREVGMRRGLDRLVTARNSLVHEGIAGVPWVRLQNAHDRLQDILREYLLRVLGYHGPYLRYSAAGQKYRIL